MGRNVGHFQYVFKKKKKTLLNKHLYISLYTFLIISLKILWEKGFLAQKYVSFFLNNGKKMLKDDSRLYHH